MDCNSLRHIRYQRTSVGCGNAYLPLIPYSRGIIRHHCGYKHRHTVSESFGGGIKSIIQIIVRIFSGYLNYISGVVTPVPPVVDSHHGNSKTLSRRLNRRRAGSAVRSGSTAPFTGIVLNAGNKNKKFRRRIRGNCNRRRRIERQRCRDIFRSNPRRPRSYKSHGECRRAVNERPVGGFYVEGVLRRYFYSRIGGSVQVPVTVNSINGYGKGFAGCLGYHASAFACGRTRFICFIGHKDKKF